MATMVTCQGLPGTLKLSLDSCDCLFGLRDQRGYLSVLLLKLFGTSFCTPHDCVLGTYPGFLVGYTLVKSPTASFYFCAIFSDQRQRFGHDVNCFQVFSLLKKYQDFSQDPPKIITQRGSPGYPHSVQRNLG